MNRHRHDFRPQSYWTVPEAIFANIKGARRQRVLRDAIAAGTVHRLPPELLADALPACVRRLLGAMHPSFMGGEYLPDLKPGEVEIARLTLPDSVMCDVTSIRGRPERGGIAYRVVDEHNGRYRCSPQRSSLPLTFGRLVRLINTTEDVLGEYRGLVVGFWDLSVRQLGEHPRDRMQVEVTSAFYPDLEDHYRAVAARWDHRWRVRPMIQHPSQEQLAVIRRGLRTRLAWADRRRGVHRSKSERNELVRRWIEARWQ